MHHMNDQKYIFLLLPGVTTNAECPKWWPILDPLLQSNSNSNSTFIALNLYLMIDSKTQKAKIRDRNR